MSLPSIIKGWFRPQTAESLLLEYQATKSQQSLSRLFDMLNQPLFHYLISQSEPALAEDVLQTTWLKIIKNPHSFQPKGNAKGWLFTIARNTLIDELRKQKKWQSQTYDDTILLVEPSNESENTLHKGDINQVFNQTVNGLAFAQKEAFILQQEGFSLHEIAQMTDSNTEAVKSRLRYAKAKLKKALEPYHD